MCFAHEGVIDTDNNPRKTRIYSTIRGASERTHHNNMVCEKCEKKLGNVITPDPWKSGARNTTESGGRKVNENKALTGARNRYNPIGSTFLPCR